MSDAAWIKADWPAPAGVHALTTRRFGAGVSLAPFDRFNLGLRSGDAAQAVTENRRQLVDTLALPAGKFRRIAIGITTIDADNVQQLIDLLIHFTIRLAKIVQPQRIANDVFHWNTRV